MQQAVLVANRGQLTLARLVQRRGRADSGRVSGFSAVFVRTSRKYQQKALDNKTPG